MKSPSEIRILIVDDDPEFREAMVYEFKKKGYQVFPAENGRMAFEYIQKNPVDVILSDVCMPHGDGMELLKLVKNKIPGLPIVMLVTGFAEITNEEARAQGAEALFSKPFDRKILVEAINKLINKNAEKWSNLDHTRENFQATLQMPNLSQAVPVDIMSLAIGGMYVSFEEPCPQVNDSVNFKLVLKDQSIPIEGTGIVRWVRVQSTENFPRGCGIEFSYLSEQDKKQVVKLLENQKLL